MFDISKDILSVSDFKRNTTELLQRMKETNRPLILTVNGKAEVVVQDAAAYQELLNLIDHLETVAGIRKGLASLAKGDTVSLDEFDRQMRQKHGIPNRDNG